MPLQNSDEYDNDVEERDLRDWIMAATEVEMLTEKQKMKSHAVEEREKMQDERMELERGELESMAREQRFCARVLLQTAEELFCSDMSGVRRGRRGTRKRGRVLAPKAFG